jgi:zinc protease
LLGEAEFTAEMFERERRYLLERLKVRQEQPVRAAFDTMQRIMYGDHPYAKGTYGTAEDLQNITLDEVKDFYSKLWNPEKIIVGFAGDCSLSEAEKLAEKFLDNMTFTDWAAERPAKPEFFRGIKRENLTLPREQTVALRTLPGVSLDEPELVNAIELLSIMENGLASNLFKVVREDNALSYSVGMTFSSGFHAGTVSFYAMTASGAGEQVLELFEAEIKRLAEGKFSDEEFENARQGAAFECEVSFAKPEALLRSALLEHYYGFDAKAILDKPAMFRNYSKEKFASALQKLFKSTDGCAVLVLPEK